MPTIEVSHKDLNRLLRKRLAVKEIQKLLDSAKAEFVGKQGDILKIEVKDTNRPDLWSVEGIARQLKGYMGKERGIPKFKASPSKIKINVHSNVLKIRPYIAGFLVKNVRITDTLLNQLVQVQEKISEHFGKKRKKLSVGLYDFKKVKPPLYYKAIGPTKVRFSPLGHEEDMNLSQILSKHEKGIEYADILRPYDAYPIFVDREGAVLSFPPIINSNYAGCLTVGKTDIFVEITGTEIKETILTCNILAQMFYDRGFRIKSVKICYPKKTEFGKNIITPYQFNDTIKIDLNELNKLLGTKLTLRYLKKFLWMMRYNLIGTKVKIPFYRKDILHPVDVYEDVALALDYNKATLLDIKDYTVGALSAETLLADKIRELMIGAGFQEILTHVLTSKDNLFKKMNLKPGNALSVSNVQSKNYEYLRPWIIPSLIDFESRNTHVDYPHKIFEVGEVVVPGKGNLYSETQIRLGGLFAGDKVKFTDLYSILITFMDQLKIRYKVKHINHNSFVKGRCAELTRKGKQIGLIGELSNKVKSNWKLNHSTTVFEINTIYL